MSVEKIGPADTMTHTQGNHEATRSHQQPAKADADTVSLGMNEGAKDLTKVSYPPFFPLGDTQSIYKK
ncbi:MAG: hypothetical protein PHC90_05320 [Syntrophorhabdaceae bacterium]|nr:hypothetical protein [Syntrophorhabdaceae bacterium]